MKDRPGTEPRTAVNGHGQGGGHDRYPYRHLGTCGDGRRVDAGLDRTAVGARIHRHGDRSGPRHLRHHPARAWRAARHRARRVPAQRVGACRLQHAPAAGPRLHRRPRRDTPVRRRRPHRHRGQRPRRLADRTAEHGHARRVRRRLRPLRLSAGPRLRRPQTARHSGGRRDRRGLRLAAVGRAADRLRDQLAGASVRADRRGGRGVRVPPPAPRPRAVPPAFTA